MIMSLYDSLLSSLDLRAISFVESGKFLNSVNGLASLISGEKNPTLSAITSMMPWLMLAVAISLFFTSHQLILIGGKVIFPVFNGIIVYVSFLELIIDNLSTLSFTSDLSVYTL